MPTRLLALLTVLALTRITSAQTTKPGPLPERTSRYNVCVRLARFANYGNWSHMIASRRRLHGDQSKKPR